jgi:hypothetical protein
MPSSCWWGHGPIPTWSARAAEAIVEGRFALGDPADPDAAEVVLPAWSPATGRSRAYVDGRLATVAELADWGRRPRRPARPARPPVAARTGGAARHPRPLRLGRPGPDGPARRRLVELDAELAALGGDERARAREIDLYRFQVTELDDGRTHRPRRGRCTSTPRRICSPTRSPTVSPPPSAVEALTGDEGAHRAGRRSHRRSSPVEPVRRARGAAAAAGSRAVRARRRPPRRGRADRPTTPSGSTRSDPAGSCSASCAASTATRSAAVIDYARGEPAAASPS